MSKTIKAKDQTKYRISSYDFYLDKHDEQN